MIYLKVEPFELNPDEIPKDFDYNGLFQEQRRLEAELEECFAGKSFEEIVGNYFLDEDSPDVYEHVILKYVTSYLIHNGQRYVSDGKIALNIDSIIEDFALMQSELTALKISREAARPKPKPHPPLVARKRQV